MNKTQMYFIWMVAIEIIRNLMYMKNQADKHYFGWIKMKITKLLMNLPVFSHQLHTLANNIWKYVQNMQIILNVHFNQVSV